MKNITIYILLLCSSLSSLAQNAPTWTSTDACVETYTGSLTIEFDQDLDVFPLPYNASYYNSTTGDYEEIIITSSPFTISDLSPGEYEIEVFISDVDIMEFCAEVYVLEIDIEFDIKQACDDDGSIVVNPSGGNEPYSYIWEDGSNNQIRSSLVAEKYHVTVTDINGCTAENSVEILAPNSELRFASLLKIRPSSCTENTGQIRYYSDTHKGGFPPYTYEWSNGSTDPYIISNLAAGLYSFTITDSEGCSISTEHIVPSGEGQPFVSVNSEETCENTSDGVIEFDIFVEEGPYHLDWDESLNNNITIDADVDDEQRVFVTLSDLAVGSYCITVTDQGNDCFAEVCGIVEAIDDSEDFEIQASSVMPSCDYGPSGSISILPSGYNAPVTYLWSNGSTGQGLLAGSIADLLPGYYSVTLTEACGATVSGSYTIGGFKHESTSSIDCQNNFALEVNITEGYYPPYTYLWSDGSSQNSLSGTLEPDIEEWDFIDAVYTCIITDGSGCEVIEEFNLIDKEYKITEVIPSCLGLDDGSFTLSLEGVVSSYTVVLDGIPEILTLNEGKYIKTFSNLAAGDYVLNISIDDCTYSTKIVKIEEGEERDWLSWELGDDDDDEDFGTCTYQFVCKDITISEDVITEAAILGQAVDNTDNLLASAVTNLPALLGPLNPLSWFGGNPLLNLTDKCGYEIICDDNVVGFHELGNTKISGAAYDIVLQNLGSNIEQNQYAACQDIFYCEATLEVFGEEEAFGFLDGTPQQNGDCWVVDCDDNIDDEFCLDDILPDIVSGIPNNPISTCMPRRERIITLLEHLDKIKLEFPEAEFEGGLITELEQLASGYPTSGCGYIVFCDKTFEVLSYSITNELDCPLIPLGIIESYNSLGYQMPSSLCNYAILPDGNPIFLCECQETVGAGNWGCIDFITPAEMVYPFGFQNDEDPTSKKVRVIKPGKNQPGFSFKNFSNKRNTSSTFPQLIAVYEKSPLDVYINEVSNKVNVTFDNQDMNFELDVISGSYEVNEAKSYILYRTSDNRQHFTLSSTEKVKIKGVTNNNEGHLLYFGTYSGTLSIGSQSIKNGSHFIGQWNNNNRRTDLFNIPNSNSSSTKFYCNSYGNFAVNRKDNLVEIYSVSSKEQLERNTYNIQSNHKQMNIEFASDKQLILASDFSNSLQLSSLTKIKQNTYDVIGEYQITNKTVSQNDIYTDISISYRGYIDINGVKLSSSSTSSFVILRFNQDFQLVGYYYDKELSCTTTIKETITYIDNNIVIGGDYISSSFKDVIGNSEYYNSGLNISTPYKSLIYDELFTNIVDSRSDKTNNVSDVLLYPNPTISKVSVVAQHEKIQSISVLDTKGTRLISIENVTAPQYNLDVSSLPSGLYIVEVKISETIITKKLVIME